MWKLQLISLLFSLYLIWRFVLPMQLTRAIRIPACLLLLLIGLRFTLFALVGGSVLAPDLPYPLLLVISWLASAMMLLGGVVLLRDLLLLPLRLLRMLRLLHNAPLPLRWHRASSFGLLLVILLLAGLGTREAILPPQVVEHEIRLPHLPAELDGLRIVQLTDLHLGTLNREAWIAQVVASSNALQPDLVLLTGDMVDGPPELLRPMTDHLAELQGRLGVYGILGNHEYYSGITQWLPEFTRLGIHMLCNEAVTLKVGTSQLALVGLTDQAAERFDEPGPDLPKATKSIPANAFTLLMAHQPKDARNNARQAIDLQLSGHTHGGMVLGLDHLVSRFNDGFINGWYQIGNMQLFVSPGTGLWSGFALRLGVPGEITLITLRSTSGSRS